MLFFRRIRAGLLVLAGLGMIVLAATTAAQGPAINRKNQQNNILPEPAAKEKDKAPEIKLPAAPKVLKWSEKKIPAFEFSQKPWPLVFAWLADQSGLPFTGVTYTPPGGTLTFSTPKGADGKPVEYTLVQVWDIINEILQSEKKFTMLRREAVFQLYPADEMPPDHLVPWVMRADLPDRGKTDIVKVLITVKTGNVAEIAVTVKRLLGDFGHVTPLEETNQLLLKATVSSIRTVIEVIAPDENPVSALNYSYKCSYIRASIAEAVLTKALGKATQIVERPGKGDPKGPGLIFGPGGIVAAPAPASTKTVRETTITHNKSTNTVFVHGPNDKIEQAKEVLKHLDVAPTKESKKILEGEARFMYHELKGGSAENMVKILSEIYKADDAIRISVAGPSRLFAWADPQTHYEINLIVNGSAPAELKTESIALTRLDAVKFADTLKSMIPETKNGSPFIEANADSNAITVRGTEEQLREVRTIIEVLDESPIGGGGKVRMINLEKASGATVAEALSLLLKQLRKYNVDLDVPESLGDDIKDIKLPQKKPELLPEPKLDLKPLPKKKIFKITTDDVRDLIHTDGGRPIPVAFQGEDEKKAEKKLEDEKKPRILIRGFGNRILLQSEDKDALDLAQQMVRILVNTEAGPGDFKVLRLRVASAVEVAKILDEAFNGPKDQAGGRPGVGGRPGGGGIPGFGGGMLGMVMGMGGAPQSTRTEAIRVVADPATNSLLIRAKPIDMLTIRRLLANELDVRDNKSEALVKTHSILLKNASAVEVADLIRQVFSESMKSPQQSTQSVGFGGFGGGGPRPVDASGGAKNVMLTVGADNRTNSIYLACPTTLFKEIELMVKTIEGSSQDTQQAMQIVPVKDIDLATLQQVIDAFSGTRTAQQTRPGQQPTGVGQGLFGPGAFGTPMRGMGGTQGIPGGGGFAFPFPIGGGAGPGMIGPGGGGTRPPGGGGGRPAGGGGPKGGASLDRGSDFFVSRVTDDPAVRVLYDPSEEQQEPPGQPDTRPTYSANPLRLTSLTQQPEDPGNQVIMTDALGRWEGTWTSIGSQVTMDFPGRAVYSGRIAGQRIEGTARNANQSWRFNVARVGPGTDFVGIEDLPGRGALAFHFVGQAPRDEGLTSPRLGVQAEIIPSSGIMILRGDKKDIQAILQIIELIRRESQPTLIEVELVPVRLGDPVDITEQLKIIYGRLQTTPYSTTIGLPATGPGTAPAPAAPATPGGTPAPATSNVQQPPNFIFLPQIRLGSILVLASKARMPEIKDHIRRLDQLPSDVHHAVPIPLKHVPASRVAAALTTFFQQRFPQGGNLNTVRITSDDFTNSLIVQAGAADMKEIRGMVEYIDTAGSSATTELRVIPLKAAVGADLADILRSAIGTGTLTATSTLGLSPTQTTTAGGATTTTQGVNQIANTKFSRVSFISSKAQTGKPIEAYVFEDIRINWDVRTNSLIISAPRNAMELVLALVNELDVPPLAKSEIRVFQLKKTDAKQFATMLQQLFLGTGGIGTAAAGGAPAGGLPGAVGGTGARIPISITISDSQAPGAPIIDLRVTIDERTNSLIVAGAFTDILVVEALFDRIENAVLPTRRSEAIRLRNQAAADVANAVTAFITALTTEYKNYNQETNFLALQRDVIVIAEPVSNSLLIDATPEYFDKVVELIAKIDTAPPQVVISVLIAEVTLQGSEEFGVEIGLQTPLLFNRGTVTGGAALGATQPAGATYATFTPGYAFNNPATPLGDNVLANPSQVGFQGITNLGVGRTSSNSGLGGFVFSAGSNTVNVLIRALKVQQRLTVLSRPQLMTLDNQTAYINVGQNVPYINGFTANGTTGVNTPVVAYQPTGVTMQVTPRITPDGRVLMRVIPDVSSISPSTINLGNGVNGTIFNTQHLETTVLAADGETVMLGGLIAKRDDKVENKVPWLGDLPGVGAAFRYRTYNNVKTELIIIMTPHIVRNHAERERILVEETRRIDWKVSDVVRIHATQDNLPFMPNLCPEPNSRPEPFRIYPGTPAEGVETPQKVVPPQTAPAPEPIRTQPVGKNGILRELLSRRAAAPAAAQAQPAVDLSPTLPTTVQYLPPPAATPPLPELLSTGMPAPLLGGLPTGPSVPIRPVTNMGPMLRP